MYVCVHICVYANMYWRQFVYWWMLTFLQAVSVNSLNGQAVYRVAGDLWEWIDSMLTIDIMSLTMQLTFHSHPLPFLSSPFLPSSPPLSSPLPSPLPSLSFVPLLLHSIFFSFSPPFLHPPPPLLFPLPSSPPLLFLLPFSLLFSSFPSPFSPLPFPPFLSLSPLPSLPFSPPPLLLLSCRSLPSSPPLSLPLSHLSFFFSFSHPSFLSPPLPFFPSPSFLLLSLSHLPPSLPAVSPYARSSDWCLEILW